MVNYQEYPIGFGLRWTDLTEQNKRLLLKVVAAKGGIGAKRLLRDEDVLLAEIRPLAPSPRILIADDDPMTVAMLRASVAMQGYEAICTSDGLEAYTILQNDGDFAAMILDMTMPHLTGLGLIAYLKTDEWLRHIPIGMVTGEQDPKVERQCCRRCKRVSAQTVHRSVNPHDAQDARQTSRLERLPRLENIKPDRVQR